MRTETVYTKEEFEAKWPDKVFEGSAGIITARRARQQVDFDATKREWTGFIDGGEWSIFNQLNWLIVDSSHMPALAEYINTLKELNSWLESLT